MPRINPEGQITRAERLVAVIAIIAAVLFHLLAIFGWGRIAQWAQEEQKKERLMVIRRVRDIAPPREIGAEQLRQRTGPTRDAGEVGGGKKAAPPDPKVREEGPEPPKEPDLSPAMEEEVKEQQPDPSNAAEQGDNSVSVVTDLPGASFIVGGQVEYRGSGTMWVRKGAPPGKYTVTFNPVAGFTTPPVQTKELVARGQIVFLGKYRRSTEIVVDSNVAGAGVTIHRPSGKPLEMTCPGRALLDDLVPGSYTAVFKDVPGYVAPAPQARALAPGGKLSFFGEYLATAGRGGAVVAAGARSGMEPGDSTRGTGQGAGAGRGKRAGGDAATSGKSGAGSRPAGLDRRVHMVVKSYPPSRIEEDFEPIPYPEIVISRSKFQQGICQVFIEITTNDDGEVTDISVMRPGPEDRPRYEMLIKAVEGAVRAWDYDKVAAVVQVDVRFEVE